MDLEIEVTRLSRLKSSHQNAQFRIENDIKNVLPPKIEQIRKRIEGIKQDVQKLAGIPVKLDEKGETVFSGMLINGKQYEDKSKAGEALLETIRQTALSGKKTVAEYKGFKISAHFDTFGQKFVGEVSGAADYHMEFGSSETGNIVRIENVINSIEAELAKSENVLQGYESQLESAKKQAGQPFVHEQELKEKQTRLKEVIKELEESGSKTTITDPYYIEVDESVLPNIKASGITHEVKTVEGKTAVRIDKSDLERVNEIISGCSKAVNKPVI